MRPIDIWAHCLKQEGQDYHIGQRVPLRIRSSFQQCGRGTIELWENWRALCTSWTAEAGGIKSRGWTKFICHVAPWMTNCSTAIISVPQVATLIISRTSRVTFAPRPFYSIVGTTDVKIESKFGFGIEFYFRKVGIS
uniref:Uncharacterized protein n=1 Tax=Romanomermis culicivorax TaxID=13658 RepID=A0A915HQS7_ROMCU